MNANKMLCSAAKELTEKNTGNVAYSNTPPILPANCLVEMESFESACSNTPAISAKYFFTIAVETEHQRTSSQDADLIEPYPNHRQMQQHNSKYFSSPTTP